MTNKPIKEIRQIIASLQLDEPILKQLNELLDLQEKKQIYAEFKVKKTSNDKSIMVNVLNKSIERLKQRGIILEEQKKLIEEQSKFKEEMFASVSHELRTPLHGILGMSHLLSETTLEEAQQSYLEVIRNSADNLMVIINDILSLSSINAGKITLSRRPFDTRKLFNELEAILNFKARNKGLGLSIIIAPNTPNYLCGDHIRLNQILVNLINNAIKFTDTGFVMLMVQVVNIGKDNTMLKFEVKDTGIGIAPDQLQSIFDSFTQLHTRADTMYEGAGLGLNIVKKLLNLMDGQIEVVSKPNEGTTFTLKIPFVIPSEEAINEFENRIQHNLKVVPKHWKSKQFLLIEDNLANILYAKDIFSNWGITVDIAETAAATRMMIAEKRYDCLLSDVKLPDGNGIEIIQELKNDPTALNYNTPIIILTASAYENERLKAKALGVSSYISKPFPPDVLIIELQKVFGEELNTAIQISKAPSLETAIDQKNDYLNHLNRTFNGKTHLITQIIDVFLEQIPGAIDKIEEGIRDQNFDIINFEAHKMKSTLKMVGMKELINPIEEIEVLSQKEENFEKIQSLFNCFKDHCRIEVKKIRALKGELMCSA